MKNKSKKISKKIKLRLQFFDLLVQTIRHNIEQGGPIPTINVLKQI